MPTYNPFAGPELDFTPLADIGKSIGGALSAGADQRLIKNAWAQSGGDYNKAVESLFKAGRSDLAKEVAGISHVMSQNVMTPAEAGALALKAKELQLKYPEGKPRPSSSTLTQKYKAEDDRDTLKATIANLEEADRLLGEDGEGVYSGGAAPFQAELGANWNYGGVMDKLGMDTEKAQRSLAYQQIVSPEAMKIMADQLKGSTAYQELLAFEKIYANPKVPGSIKKAQLRRMLEAAKRHMATKQGRVNELGGASGYGEDQWTEGETYDTPMGPKRYLGNDTWEDAE